MSYTSPDLNSKALLALLFSVISLGMLAGCDNNHSTIEKDLNTYLIRIANVQQAERLPAPQTLSQTLPDKRDIYLTIPQLTLGLLDSYELRKCQLFQLIAQRNSSLGRVQDEFRGFDYEIQLLHGLRECIEHSDISSNVRQQLINIADIKQQDIIKHWHNLLYTSVAMRAQLTAHTWLPTQLHTSSLQQALIALNNTDQVVKSHQLDSNHSPLPMIAMTPYQEVLEKQRILGQLKFSLVNSTLWLTTLTQQLETNDHRILCGPHQDRTRLNYLLNVFHLYYLDKVQPALAQIDSVYLQLEPQLALFSPSDKSPPIFPIQQAHENFREATLAHVEYWRTLFQRCGVTVGH